MSDTPTSSNGHSQSKLQWLTRTLKTGGPGQCVFAINNACNAKCDFCSFSLDKLPREHWNFVPLAGAKDALDILNGLFVQYIIITGGEPMMHDDLEGMVRHARSNGQTVLLVTNGSMLTETRCRALKEWGVSSMVISIDAPTAEAHEKNRGLPKVCERIKHANEIFRELNVQTTASVTMSRLVGDYEALAKFLQDLGFTCVTFSYPLTNLNSSFLGYAKSDLVNFTREELVEEFEKVKALKKKFPVINPLASIEDMQHFLRREPQKFGCLGGYRYFYLDWELNVWRCHHWAKPMGSIYDLDESKYIHDGCTSCMIDCFRDSSVMQHVAVSVTDALKQAGQGNVIGAARQIFKRSNLASVKAAMENRAWISRI